MADDRRGGFCETLPVTWLAFARDESGEETLRIGRREDAVHQGGVRIAEWPGIARLTANADGSNPRWEIAADAPPLVVSRIKNEVGRALLHQAAGGMSLHGSSVALAGRAFAFVGLSGAGKSTLAAYLTESAGASLLADDATLLSTNDAESAVTVIPTSGSSHALDDRARGLVAAARTTGAIHARGVELEKTIIAPRASAEEPTKLAGICVLAWDESGATERAARLSSLSEVEAIAHLVPHLIRFSVDDPARISAELDALARLARSGLVSVLTRPRALSALEACRDLLLGMSYH